jgi:hypothetical protein
MRGVVRGVLLGLAIVGVAALGVLQATQPQPRDAAGVAGDGSASGDPVATVLALDAAYRDVDCEAFTASTTAAFRTVSHGADQAGVFDCTAWVPIAAGYTVDGEYAYDLEVVASTIDGATAEVVTRESDARSGEQFDYRYTLVTDDDRWLIAAIVPDPTAEEG